MSSFTRQVVEGLQAQGTTEEVVYYFSTTPVGGSPSSPLCVAYDEATWADVSAQVLSGAPSLTGETFYSAVVRALRRDKTYRVVCAWLDAQSRRKSAYFRVRGEL